MGNPEYCCRTLQGRVPCRGDAGSEKKFCDRNEGRSLGAGRRMLPSACTEPPPGSALRPSVLSPSRLTLLFPASRSLIPGSSGIARSNRPPGRACRALQGIINKPGLLFSFFSH